jgi:hypothetical protein
LRKLASHVFGADRFRPTSESNFSGTSRRIAGIEKAGKVMTGPREKAELQAHSLINKWLEKHPAPKR